jgi:hypothetical protein
MQSHWFSKKVFLFLWLALLLATLAAAGQASMVKLKVIVKAANIRSKPDLASAILKTVSNGTLFESPGKEGRWYKVNLPPDAKGTTVTGYVYDSLVEVVEEIKEEALKAAIGEAPKKEAAGEKAIPAEIQKTQPEPAPAASVFRKRSLSFRPYAKFGVLATPPTAADLNYLSVDGGNLDQYLDVAAFSFGGGVQVLFSLSPDNTINLGLDLGAQKLFSSVFDLGTSDIVYEDIHHENEFSFYLLGLFEFRPRQSPLFFQGGLGMHLVSWSWDYTYSGQYSDEYKEESGTEVNLGLMLAGGLDLPVNDKISVPIMLRMDGLMRYGMLLHISLSIGLSFH